MYTVPWHNGGSSSPSHDLEVGGSSWVGLDILVPGGGRVVGPGALKAKGVR